MLVTTLSTATLIFGLISPIFTSVPGNNNWYSLTISGLAIKNSIGFKLFLFEISVTVSPGITVYVFWFSMVPNNKYLVKSLELVKMYSFEGIYVSFIVMSSLIYMSFIVSPSSITSGWLLFL